MWDTSQLLVDGSLCACAALLTKADPEFTDYGSWFAYSSPVRELPDGSLIMGIYSEWDNNVDFLAFGATIKSSSDLQSTRFMKARLLAA